MWGYRFMILPSAMSDTYILDAQGEPVLEPDLTVWGRWMGRAERHIGNDLIGLVKVSTVFLGLDHSWASGPPLLWETMVFGGPLDGEMERYRTRDEAIRGHQFIMERVKNAEAYHHE